MRLCSYRVLLPLWIFGMLISGGAGSALAQTQTVTIIDGPGAGTVLTVTPVTPTPLDPYVTGVVNSGPGTVGAIEDHPGLNTPGPHYHGTLNGLPDPNPTGAGWGHISPFNGGGGGPPSNIFNFVEQFGVAGSVPPFGPNGIDSNLPPGFPDGPGPFDGPPAFNVVWIYTPDPAAPGGGVWSGLPPGGNGTPIIIDDGAFQEQLGGIGSILIADTPIKGGAAPDPTPVPANPPAAPAPTTTTPPRGPWTPAQGVPTSEQISDEVNELKNMYDGYVKANDYAKKHPDNLLAQQNAEGLKQAYEAQGNKVGAMMTQVAVNAQQAAAGTKDTPTPTTPGTPTSPTPPTTPVTPTTPTTPTKPATPGGVVAPPNNTSLNGQPMRPDQLPTVQALAAQFKGTQDLAGAAQAVFNTVGTSFVWSNDGDYMNGARSQNDLFSARQMACFEFVHWIGHLCGPQRVAESSGAPFGGSSAAGVKSLQNTSWDRTSAIPAGKIVLGVARAFNNNAGYYHVGISLGNGKVISLGGDSNLHIENTGDLFPRWAYSDVQVHDYNFFQQQGDRSQRTPTADDGSSPGTTPPGTVQPPK